MEVWGWGWGLGAGCSWARWAGAPQNGQERCPPSIRKRCACGVLQGTAEPLRHASNNEVQLFVLGGLPFNWRFHHTLPLPTGKPQSHSTCRYNVSAYRCLLSSRTVRQMRRRELANSPAARNNARRKIHPIHKASPDTMCLDGTLGETANARSKPPQTCLTASQESPKQRRPVAPRRLFAILRAALPHCATAHPTEELRQTTKSSAQI